MKTIRPRNRALAGAVLVALLCNGCYSTWDISPRELGKLNGYRAPARVKLYDQERGAAVPFDQDALFVVRAGPSVREEALVGIDLAGPFFTGYRRSAGRPWTFDLRTVDRVQVKRPNPAATAGLTLGVIVGAATLVALIAFVESDLGLHGVSQMR